MEDGEMEKLSKDVNEFLSNNQERMEIITDFQDHLINMDSDSYHQVIDFISKNSNAFFNNHQNGILFFHNIIIFSKTYYKKLELILDLCINFANEIKGGNVNATEYELLGISFLYPNSVYYLFSKNFFSIETIVEQSAQNALLFCIFLPEIQEFDSEYADIKKKDLLENGKELKDIQKFYEIIIADPQKHILNRQSNYHPSILHKSIRENDIFKFQNLLSANNININEEIEFSYYERAKEKDKNLSLIKVALLYDSYDIIKFLILQDVILEDDILLYAYFSSNMEFINLYNNKFSHDYMLGNTIIKHNHELINYYIENFESKESNEGVRTCLLAFPDDENNFYQNLNYTSLISSIMFLYYKIIESCLSKITFISKNYEYSSNDHIQTTYSLFNLSIFDYELFKFIYAQRMSNLNKIGIGGFFICMNYAISSNINDVFKFLFYEQKKEITNPIYFLKKGIEINHEIGNFFLDFIKEEKQYNQSDNSIYNTLKKQITFDEIKLAIKYYNKDILVKMITLFELCDSNEQIAQFINELCNMISSKMIFLLFKDLVKILPMKKLKLCSSLLEYNGYLIAAEFIISNLPDK